MSIENFVSRKKETAKRVELSKEAYDTALGALTKARNAGLVHDQPMDSTYRISTGPYVKVQEKHTVAVQFREENIGGSGPKRYIPEVARLVVKIDGSTPGDIDIYARTIGREPIEYPGQSLSPEAIDEADVETLDMMGEYSGAIDRALAHEAEAQQTVSLQ